MTWKGVGLDIPDCDPGTLQLANNLHYASCSEHFQNLNGSNFEPGQRTEMLMMGMEDWIAPHRDHGFDCIFTARLPVALWPLSALCSPASFKHFRISLVSSSCENGWAGGFCWLYQETWQPMTGWQMLCLPSRCPLYTSGNVWLLTGAEVDHHHIDIGCGSHRLSRQKVGVEGHLCDLSN